MPRLIPSSLHRADFEHDACGVGFVAKIDGQRSHEIILRALASLKGLAYRGAIDADAITGDGAGILAQLPTQLLLAHLAAEKISLARAEDLGVGMFFFPKDAPEVQAVLCRIVEEAVATQGLRWLNWRLVPVSSLSLGRKAPETQPLILQALIARPGEIDDEDFERRLFLVQKIAERRATEARIVVGAVHQALVQQGLPLNCDLVVETGEARDVHQVASLIGLGANAVHPWLALEIVAELASGLTNNEALTPAQARGNHLRSPDTDLLKVTAKMGISTLLSYRGSQLFEALGLGAEVIDDCFAGVPSPIAGMVIARSRRRPCVAITARSTPRNRSSFIVRVIISRTKGAKASSTAATPRRSRRWENSGARPQKISTFGGALRMSISRSP